MIGSVLITQIKAGTVGEKLKMFYKFVCLFVSLFFTLKMKLHKGKSCHFIYSAMLLRHCGANDQLLYPIFASSGVFHTILSVLSGNGCDIEL